MSLDKQIAALQADLNAAHYVTYLTGAGVSTPSHIPDYRSKNGIYNGISESPEQILSEDTICNGKYVFSKCSTKYHS